MDEKLEHRLGHFPVRGVLTLGNKTFVNKNVMSELIFVKKNVMFDQYSSRKMWDRVDSRTVK